MTEEIGNKILIIGVAGCGKTTLAKKLSGILQLPLIHLDRHYWIDSWGNNFHLHISDEEWNKKILALCQSDKWVMDGNYTKLLSLRLKFATTVIFLDTPRWKCLLRVIIRRFRLFHNKARNDIPDNCNERLNFKLYRWIWNYPKRSRLETLRIIDQFKGNVYHFQSNLEIDKFVKLIVKEKGLHDAKHG